MELNVDFNLAESHSMDAQIYALTKCGELKCNEQQSEVPCTDLKLGDILLRAMQIMDGEDVSVMVSSHTQAEAHVNFHKEVKHNELYFVVDISKCGVELTTWNVTLEF